jgi:uncharacterized RDD family membrane protein YckC
VDGVAVLVGLMTALIVSVLRLPETIDKLLLAIGGAAFVLWSIGYFVAFWSTTGETPGNRLMRIRVRRSDRDEPLRPRRSLLRLVGMVLAAIPLLLGFLPILLNDRRRGLHDLLGRSVVVSAPERLRGGSDARAVTPKVE